MTFDNEAIFLIMDVLEYTFADLLQTVVPYLVYAMLLLIFLPLLS
jgi:hypothetical protein